MFSFSVCFQAFSEEVLLEVQHISVNTVATVRWTCGCGVGVRRAAWDDAKKWGWKKNVSITNDLLWDQSDGRSFHSGRSFQALTPAVRVKKQKIQINQTLLPFFAGEARLVKTVRLYLLWHQMRFNSLPRQTFGAANPKSSFRDCYMMNYQNSPSAYDFCQHHDGIRGETRAV